ncbi:penicillin-binding transpeptidase domain-containing protein [Catenulispora sp. EB89]|uniref:penicillin-binding transpeptidase domain-containing protein n=1 Tax=Catenulispora sp. EB89 TaxID=3156257 RepID=UPI003512164B
MVAAALLTTSGCGLFGSSSKSSSSDSKNSGAAASTSSSPQVTPQNVAQAFLTAWSGGDFDGAGKLTDDATTATARLKAVMGSLSPQKLTLTLGSQENVAAGADTASPPPTSASGTASGSAPASSSSASASASAATLARFSFNVSADFGNNLVWTYDSALSLVQGPAGTPVVKWNSAVIQPQLGPTALLKAVPPKQSVVDATGNPVDVTKHPSLTAAVNALTTHVPANFTPTQLTVEFVDPKTGSPVAPGTIKDLGAATSAPTTVKTTIDPKVQTAIEAALNGHANAGMVAIQPSTGDILGMASNDAGIPSLAYKAARAPGSTFKVITTALALQQGLTASTPVKCTSSATVEGKPITNDPSLANGIANAHLKDAFEQSCNTAFVNLALDGKLGSDYNALSNEAKTYFGMNQKWDLGMGPATYGTAGDLQVPPADGLGTYARDAFGQGDIEMSPLTMASVAATVCNNGQFKQPILVPGTPQVSATPLPAGVDSQLTTLMQDVISDSPGTAYGYFPAGDGLAGKTGSAESNDTPKTGKTDSWMIVFDKKHDIAFGALTLNGGFGIQNSGPAIDTALKNLGYI